MVPFFFFGAGGKHGGREKRVPKPQNTNSFTLSRGWKQHLLFDTSHPINLKTEGQKNQWIREMDHSPEPGEMSQLVSDLPTRPGQSVKLCFSGETVPLTKKEKPQVLRK